MSHSQISNESPFTHFERTGWEGCTDAYDTLFTPLTTASGRRLIAHLAIRDGERVLDTACGPGHVTAEIARLGASPVGTDFSTKMIERARTRYPGIPFELEDAEALRRASDSFDAVTMNFGILHLANPERAVAEAARVLRKGGRFGFTVWAPPSDALGFSVVLEAIECHGDAKVVLPAGPPFFKYSAPEASRGLLEGAGLSHFAFEKIDLLWQLSSPEDFFTAFYEGTARTGGMLRAQPKECLERIREAVIDAVRDRFGSAEGSGVEIPMPAMMYSARR